MSNYLKIERSRLRRLLEKEEELAALESLGVDNWEGYGLQWDEDEVGFKRLGNDVVAWDQFINERFEQI